MTFGSNNPQTLMVRINTYFAAVLTMKYSMCLYYSNLGK